jgi:hypothetical protein
MTENNINDLRKARYMSLSCPPASPETKSLVEDIIDIITKSEKRQRARKADEVPVFNSTVGLIIGDLLLGFHTREAGWSHRSLFGPKLKKHPV